MKEQALWSLGKEEHQERGTLHTYGLGSDSLPSFVIGLISLSLFFLSEKVLSQGMVCKAGIK